MRIFHIAADSEWRSALERGHYVPSRFAADGFIHASHAEQLPAVAAARFRARTDLVLLEIDTGLVNCEVVVENLDGGAERYPHIYGVLPLGAVTAVHPMEPGAKGDFELAFARATETVD